MLRDGVLVKGFEQTEYDASDKPARAALLKIMESHPKLYVKDGKQRGVDSEIYRRSDDMLLTYFELERKKNWGNEKFHFPDVQFLAKKIHFGPELQNNVFWLLFNDDFSRHLIVDFADICNPAKCQPQKRWTKVAEAEGRPGGLDDLIIIPKKYMFEGGAHAILNHYENI